MTQEAKLIADAKKSNKKLTEKQQQIIETAIAHPRATYREIAKLCDADVAYTYRTLKNHHVQPHLIEEYKLRRADVLASLQQRIVASITDKDIMKASFAQRILALCQLYDKERLERGLATEHTTLLITTIRDLQKIRWARKSKNDAALHDVTFNYKLSGYGNQAVERCESGDGEGSGEGPDAYLHFSSNEDVNEGGGG